MSRIDDDGSAASWSGRPSTGWKEMPEPDEEDRARRFLTVIHGQQAAVARERREPLRRGFHAKLHAGFLARFQVLPDLPECARHGVFSEPREYDAAVRFSNGDFRINEDSHKEPRGIGIKLVGVPGPGLREGQEGPAGQEDAVTQDFLATSHSITSTVRNARQFMAFIEATDGDSVNLIQLARSVGTVEAARIVARAIATVRFSRVRSMATERYHGTAPIQMGPYAVKYIVQPAPGTERPPRCRGASPDFLREELAERLRRGDLLFDFLVQFFVDERRTPIEDTSVRWNRRASPPLKVARLRIPSCDLNECAVRQQSDRIERLAFSPWHALEAHRPLGSIMRARRIAYPASARFREADPEPPYLPLHA